MLGERSEYPELWAFLESLWPGEDIADIDRLHRKLLLALP